MSIIPGINAIDTEIDKTKVMEATFVLQCICFAVSMIVLIARTYQLYVGKEEKQYFKSFGVSLLNISPILMLILNQIYVFFHATNYYSALYSTTPFIDCAQWYPLILYSQIHGRMFMYLFLMIRSSLSFSHSVFYLDIKIVIGFIAVYVIAIEIALILVMLNVTAINPFAGFCFRVFNDTGLHAANTVVIIDVIASIIVLIIFWYKSVQVCRFAKTVAIAFQKNSEKNVNNDTATDITKTNKNSIDINMYNAFQKHILLGILTCIGSSITFFGLQFLTVLLGISFTIDVTMNNLLIFLMFNNQEKLYTILCCHGCGLNKSRNEANLSLIITGSAAGKFRSQQSEQTDTLPTPNTNTNNLSKKQRSNIELHIH